MLQAKNLQTGDKTEQITLLTLQTGEITAIVITDHSILTNRAEPCSLLVVICWNRKPLKYSTATAYEKISSGVHVVRCGEPGGRQRV